MASPAQRRVGLTVAAAAAGVVAASAAFAASRRRGRATAVTAPMAVFEWPHGLTEAEASARWREGQTNTAHLKPIRTWEYVRRESVFTVFNLNLIGLSVVQAMLSEWVGAAITMGMLALTTGIRVVQQRLAAQRMADFKDATSTRYSVIRDGKVRSIDPDRVVPGDVLLAGPGDQILVDGELLGPGSLTVDTSALTGQRGWERVDPGGTVSGGTFCVTGRAAYRADRVGNDRIVSARVAQRPSLAATPTPLELLVARILRILLVVVIAYVALLLAAYFRLEIGAPGEGFIDAAPVIFSLAPTGLYLMIIVSYATGTAELAARGALVHSARSVESLAEATTLCFTELGILAGTSMELVTFTDDEGAKVPESRMRQVLGDFARTTATPTAVSRLLADTYDGERRAVIEQANHLRRLGWSGITFGEPDATGTYVLAGPTLLEGLLTVPLPALPAVDDQAAQETLILAHAPDRVPLTDPAGRPRLPDGLVALGAVRFRTRLRGEAMEVVRGFRAAGVRVKAFSSGSPDDALAVLKAAGLTSTDEVDVLSIGRLSRPELERIPADEWGAAAQANGLFGGLTPFQVGELVRAMRRDGQVVTVVGDGVADLPALAEANLAVAQPASTQAALGLADIVLLDNSPGALLRVLERGQSIVRGLVDVIKLNLTMVLCSALLIVDVRLLSFGFPYTSGHGSIISIVAVTIPSLALTLWSHAGAVSRVHYARALPRFVVPAGVLMSLAGLWVYLHFVEEEAGFAYAQLAVAYTLLYAGLLVSVLIRRTWRVAGLAVGLAAAVTALPLIPAARRQFRLDWLQPGDYAVVAAAVALWLVALLATWWVMRWAARRATP